MKIIGVTKCPVGVAHTYIAAEKLEMIMHEANIDIKIETQGMIGIENKLTDEDIRDADYVIIAADAPIENKERFIGKKVLEVSINFVLKNDDFVIDKIKNSKVLKNNSENIKTSFIKQLLNGVSYMIPFVVVGGLLIAFSITINSSKSSFLFDQGSMPYKINKIGMIGFNLMIPILSGFISFSIAGKSALAPSMICAQVANSPDILGTESGAGFLGAIVVGFLAGYLVKLINKLKVPKSLKPIMPVFVIPLLCTIILSILIILFLGQPISLLTIYLQNMLSFLASRSSTSIILGSILGGMIAVDMGGPINKVAFLFGVASISTGNPDIMGCVACAIPVPALATGFASLLRKDLFSADECAASIPSILMGFIGITEGAIPFASLDPKRIIPSIILGSSISGALSMLLRVTNIVPVGGPIVGFLGATNSLLYFLLSIAVGTLVSTVLIIIFKCYTVKKTAIK